MGRLSTVKTEYLNKNHRINWATRSKTSRAFDYLVKAVGDMDVCNMTFADAEDYVDWLIRVRNQAEASVNGYIKTVKPVLNWAIRRGMAETNPFNEIRLFKIKPTIRVYDDAEVHAMLHSANLIWRGRIIAALSAGLRKSEVLNLTFADIDFEKELITVRGKQDTDLTWQWDSKNREERILPLVPKLANILLLLNVELPAGQPYPFLSEKLYWDRKEHIGQLSDRIKSCPDENWRPFKTILRRARIKSGTFHDLRRTCLTQWSKSMPYQELQRLAGHTDLQTTLTYYSAVGSDYLTRARQASPV